jgi:hypothetical protein
MPQYSTNKRYPQREKSRQRLQRTLRSLPSDSYEPRRPDPVREYANLYETEEVATAASEERIQNASEQPAEVQYQCTSCDMMVSSSDSYCPFCGAIFADEPSAEDADEMPLETVDAGASVEEEERYKPPERFDVLSMMKPRAKSRELLYAEALHGFAGSARLLEEIESVISEVSSLGTDTLKARRLITDAWEACRDGDWPLVSALAKQTEELISPSIPDLVRGELAKARNLIVEAKAQGTDTSQYIVMMKSAMSALHGNDVDEALRITKQLLDSLREDSAMWKGASTREPGRCL